MAWNDSNGEFHRKFHSLHNAADLDKSRYGLFFAFAGHATLIDYPTASILIAEEAWANGGVVASVCHGSVIFANILDNIIGEPDIKGRKISDIPSRLRTRLGSLLNFGVGTLRWSRRLLSALAPLVCPALIRRINTLGRQGLIDLSMSAYPHLGRFSFR